MLAKSDPGPGARPPTTDDQLLGGRIRLSQPAEGYRIAIDPVLLAAAIPVRPGDHVVDLGTGVGAAALCVLTRLAECRVTGIEVQPDMADLARRNMARNNFTERATILERAIQDLGPDFDRMADHVMANPPYLPPGRAAPSRRSDRATVEVGATLADWVSAAVSVVRPKGSVTFIQRADRLDGLLEALRKSAGEIIVWPLWPKAGVAAKRILVQARKGVSTPLKMAPGTVLHRDDGAYTPEVEDILRHSAPLDLGAES